MAEQETSLKLVIGELEAQLAKKAESEKAHEEQVKILQKELEEAAQGKILLKNRIAELERKVKAFDGVEQNADFNLQQLKDQLEKVKKQKEGVI